jgi:hypothetical protein
MITIGQFIPLHCIYRKLIRLMKWERRKFFRRSTYISSAENAETSSTVVVVAATELLERTAYYGIALNLVTYLVTVLHQGTGESISIVYNWSGTAWILPLLGGFLADAYWGRYWTIIVSAVIYLMVSEPKKPIFYVQRKVHECPSSQYSVPITDVWHKIICKRSS